VSVELGDEISPEINTRVRALAYLVERRGIPGVSETVPSYRALLVYYDPLAVEYDELCRRLRGLVDEATPSALPPARRVELPCCYDDELGLDLAAAADHLGLAVDELVKLHADAEHLVYFIGFTPGLPYMGGMPERLHIPRLETPRVRVPAGSVSIGGTQCCIYPVESPGGFWVLGRTPVPLYDPGAADPILLRPGDRVTFRPIDRAEFEAIGGAARAGTYTPVIT
jgi:KipI family sensor histidine kinase inhibitor